MPICEQVYDIFRGKSETERESTRGWAKHQLSIFCIVSESHISVDVCLVDWLSAFRLFAGANQGQNANAFDPKGEREKGADIASGITFDCLKASEARGLCERGWEKGFRFRTKS
jgi:hypothetical protein